MTSTNILGPTPSTPDFREALVLAYRATNGTIGHTVNGAPLLLLTTTDPNGAERTRPLYYGTIPEGWLIVASQGGAATDPLWFRNLQADNRAVVQVLGSTNSVRATVVEGDARTAMWKIMTTLWPLYDKYQERTTRTLPVIQLAPS